MRELVTINDQTWKIEETEFISRNRGGSTVDCFTLRKPANLVAKYVDLCRDFHGGSMVELGIDAGGSTAMIALLAEPRKLVACDLKDEVVALTDFVALRQLGDSVRPLFGVDQGNRAQMLEIMGREFGDAPLDLVVDDASHLYEETKVSLEVLLPRVRPGGLFIIEDWAADYMRYRWVITAMKQQGTELATRLDQQIGGVMEQRAKGLGPFPLHRLAPELMQVCFNDNDVIDDVRVDWNWITVRRGNAELDPATFRLEDHHAGDWQWVLP
jgi:predicted O-methyltransferase YrrM